MFPKVTVCPPKNTYTDLNYYLMRMENMTLDTDMRNELTSYAMEVVLVYDNSRLCCWLHCIWCVFFFKVWVYFHPILWWPIWPSQSKTKYKIWNSCIPSYEYFLISKYYTIGKTWKYRRRYHMIPNKLIWYKTADVIPKNMIQNGWDMIQRTCRVYDRIKLALLWGEAQFHY